MNNVQKVCCLLMGCHLVMNAAFAQPVDNRKELHRVDLSGAPNMEVVSSMVEYQKGQTLARHFHHGVEAAYVIQGTQIQVPGKEPVTLATGTPVLNLRDVAHGGYVVVGDTPLKLFTVHIVDKGKPLYDLNVK